MEIHYCYNCKNRISSADIDLGNGFKFRDEYYCRKCFQSLSMDPIRFHNKIFMCDIVKYSARDSTKQYDCYAELTRIIRETLDILKAELIKDVIALPTGDGIILNYMKQDPDIHLRTALEVLRMFHEYNKKASDPIELRIGLNTHVDAIVIDVNNQKNIVGVGVNMAQRIMDLGSHGQILMHGRVFCDLSNYETYTDNLREIGDYTVKHGKVLPIVQYVNSEYEFLDNEPPPQEKAKKKAQTPQITLDKIIRNRVTESIEKIMIPGNAREALDYLDEYLEEILDEKKAFQNIKISVIWIANEMIDNVFKWGNPAPEDQVCLSLDYTKTGIQVSTEQVDVPGFDLDKVFNDPSYENHFLMMIKNRGILVRIHRDKGCLTFSCEVPNNFTIRKINSLEVVRGKQIQNETKDAKLKEPMLKRIFGIFKRKPKKGKSDDISLKSQSITRIKRALNIKLERMEGEDIFVIIAKGELGASTISRLKSNLDSLLEQKNYKVIIDLSGVTYISSTGVGTLIKYQGDFKDRGGDMILAKPNESVGIVFELLGIHEQFSIVDNIDSAVNFIKTHRE